MQVIPGKNFEFTLLLKMLTSMKFSFYVESGACCQKAGEVVSIHSYSTINLVGVCETE